MPTIARSSSRQPGGLERDYLSILGGFAATLLVLLAMAYGVATWIDERQDQIDQLDTALVLSQKALDRFFIESQAQLRELSLDLDETGALDHPAAAHRLLARYAELHADAIAVTLMSPDGQILTTTSAAASPDALPSMATYPSFQAFLYALGNSRDLRLGRPLLGPLAARWVFPMRYPMRDASGRLVGVIEVCVPVDFLEQFWRTAPVTARASIGLLRDDGFLISRYPVPDGHGPQELYGQPGVDSLRIHLLANQFPAKGYVEGDSRAAGPKMANAFMRLEHFPVTLFVHMPTAEFRAAWWDRVQASYALVLVLAVIGVLGYRSMAVRQKAWGRERRANEDKQRALVDHLVAGVVVFGPDAAVASANPEAREILHLPADATDVSGTRFDHWKLVAADGLDLAFDDYPLRRVMREKRPLNKITLGVKGLHKDTLWLLCSFNPEIDHKGRLLNTIVTFVDISADRNAEREMRRSERRFRLLYETNLDAVLQTAIGGDVLAANPAACAMFGADEATILALGRKGLVSPTDARFDELIARRELAGHANGVVAMLRADGTPFEAEASSVMYADDGEIYCSWVLHDVTERRVAEAAVAARIAAEDANRAKTEFIAHMSHELRTPLNAILGFSAVLQLDTRRAMHPAHLQQVGHIRNAGAHLLAMISDLLDLSAIESGNVRLNLEPIDPCRLVAQAGHDLEARAEAADVRIEIRPSVAPVGCMLGDATRFSQIVLNLLSNAIKYNKPGGRALVELAVADERLVLTFRDNGRGVSLAQLETLFQPFNRLGHETSNIEGTGIGLVITKRLVGLMGGTIRVRSAIGVGSEFEVDLPFVPAEPETRADAPAEPASSAGRIGWTATSATAVFSVLYIDDDPINRLLVKSLMEMRDDVRLHLASSGAEGLAMAKALRPALVLSDMCMPGMSGIEVMHAMRSDPSLRDTRIVAVSASAMPGEIERALSAGFDNYLTKPVAVEHLFQEIDRTQRMLGADMTLH